MAKGASLYGRIRVTGKGIRIKAGASRSYYIGLESSMPAVPGFTPPLKALCVVPQGMEEGAEVLIEGRDLALVTGQPAEFRFFSSEVRSGDRPGEIIPDAERDLGKSAFSKSIWRRSRTFRRVRPSPCRSTRSSRNSARSNYG